MALDMFLGNVALTKQDKLTKPLRELHIDNNATIDVKVRWIGG
jgi:hypothetical protein